MIIGHVNSHGIRDDLIAYVHWVSISIKLLALGIEMPQIFIIIIYAIQLLGYDRDKKMPAKKLRIGVYYRTLHRVLTKHVTVTFHLPELQMHSRHQLQAWEGVELVPAKIGIPNDVDCLLGGSPGGRTGLALRVGAVSWVRSALDNVGSLNRPDNIVCTETYQEAEGANSHLLLALCGFLSSALDEPQSGTEWCEGQVTHCHILH